MSRKSALKLLRAKLTGDSSADAREKIRQLNEARRANQADSGHDCTNSSDEEDNKHHAMRRDNDL